MSVIQKGGGGDEESSAVAQEKAKSAQVSTAMSRTKLAARAFSDAAATSSVRGERVNADRAKEAEVRGLDDPISQGQKMEGPGSTDGSYTPHGKILEDDDGDDEGDGDGKSGSSSGGGPSPDLDLSTSDYVSFADTGTGEVVSKREQKAEVVKAEQQKAETEASVDAGEGPKEIKVTKADGTTITTAAPAASGTGAGKTGGAAPAAAPAAPGKTGAAPATPGKSGGGSGGAGGGPSAGPG